MTDRHERIAFLGAGGAMGFAMARNLLRDGFAVTAWNRTREKAEPLEEDGGEVADGPADAARGAGVILTMLADTDAVLEAIEQATQGEVAQGTVWLQMSTIGERGTKRCADFAREHGLELVDAPVLGTKQPAEQGELIVLASAPESLQERMQAIFDVVGKRTMWVGEPGAGSQLKVAINSWLTAVVEGCAETLALAEGMGLDPKLVLEAVEGGPLDTAYMQMKGKAMIERSFEPSFRLALAAKDAGLALEAAEQRELDLPLVRTISERLSQGAGEHPDEDVAATFLSSAPRTASA